MNAKSLAFLAGLIVLVGVAVVVLVNSSGRDEDLGMDDGIEAPGEAPDGPPVSTETAPGQPGGTGEGGAETAERAGAKPQPADRGDTYAVKARVLDAETRQPLEGARIRLFKEGESEKLQETLTDAEGRFTLEGLARETVYSGSAWKSGYAEVRKHGLKLAKDDEKTVVELDPIHLARAGAVTGTVSTEHGNLIAGAKVTFNPLKRNREGISYPDRSETYNVFTEEDGRYRNFSLPAGEYRVMAQAQGYARAMLPSLEIRVGAVTEADFKLTPEKGVSGTVRDKQGAPVRGARIYGDFQGKGGPFELPETVVADDGTFTVHHLPGGTCTLVVRAPGYAEVSRRGVPVPSEKVAIVMGLANCAIEGRVEGPGGPLDAFRIKYYEEKPSNYQLAAVAILKAKWKTFAEAGGAYKLDGLAPGLYALEVYAEGCLGKKQGGIQLDEGKTKSGVNFKLGKGYPVQGKVLRKVDGAPIQGATVVVNLVIKGPFGEIPFRPSDISTTTDGEGAWELTQVKEGTLSISVTHKDYGKATRKDIPIKPDEPPAEIVIQMEPGGRVSGTCVDAQGQGVFGDYVVIQQPQDPSMRYTMQTDKDGKYVSELLAPGMYQVIRVDSRDTSKVKVKFATVKSGETLVVDFGEASGCRVFGTVTDRGAPVQNCQVVLIERGESMASQKDLGVSTTNEKGQYELTGVKRGTYYVFAQTGQMAGTGKARTFRVEFSVATGELSKRVDIAFPSGSFSGTVMDGVTGKPLVGATVVVMASDTPDVRTFDEIIEYYGGQARTDDKGTFEVGGLPPGRYDVQVIQAGYARKVHKGRDLGAAEAVKLTIAMGPESRIEGMITGPSGKPVENASVYLLDKDGNAFDFTFGATFSDPGGAYKIQGLPEGAYVVLIEAEGFAFQKSGVVTVPAAGVVKKDFALAAEGRLKVTVLSGGAAVADALVKVFDSQGKEVQRQINERNMYTSRRERRTGKDGAATVAMLPAGAYRVTVTAGGSTKTLDVVLEGPGEKAVTVEMAP